jgi:carbon-monoxide dehydrogenase medium subunit
MYAFTYHRPGTVGEAERLLRGGSEPKLLAGGMTLLPVMKQRLAAPSDLVDLGRVAELQTVRVERGEMRIGAMVRHATVASHDAILRHAPVLAELAAGIGDVQVRNRGTIGGSIANNDPAADYPAAVLGLCARVETSRREIAADEFFRGLFETALERDELITAVRFPIPDAAAYVKFRHPASRFALVGVLVAQLQGAVRVAVTGAGPCVFRVAAFEAALTRRLAPEALEGLSVPPHGLNADIHADPEYRAHLIGVLARRAVARMVGRGS